MQIIYHIVTVDLCIKQTAPHQEKKSPLYLASEGGYVNIVRLLLRFSAIAHSVCTISYSFMDIPRLRLIC